MQPSFSRRSGGSPPASPRTPTVVHGIPLYQNQASSPVAVTSHAPGSVVTTARVVGDHSGEHNGNYNNSNNEDSSCYSGETLHAGGGAGGSNDHHSAAPGTDRFVVQGYKDTWAAALFILCFLCTSLLGIHNMRQPAFFSETLPAAHRLMSHGRYRIGTNGEHSAQDRENADADGRRQMSDLMWHQITSSVALATCLTVFALVLSFYLFKRHCQATIQGMFWAATFNCLAQGVLLFIRGAIFWGILCVVVAALMPLAWSYWKNTIPLTAVFLKTAGRLATAHYGTMVASLLLLALTLATYTLMFFAAAPTLVDLVRRPHSTPVVLKAFCLLTMMFWVVQVLANVVHVMASGVTATWYFAGTENMPRNPSLASLKRACTTSFGSICFGSLIVAVLKAIRVLANLATRHKNEFVRCIADCVIGCVEGMIRFFNVYAFTHIAIYGCSYLEAAEHTYNLMFGSYQNFWTLLLNDDFCSLTLEMLKLINALTIGLVTGLLFWSYPLGIVGFVTALLLQFVAFRVLYSTVVTLLVCLCQEPQVMEHSNPSFANKVNAAMQLHPMYSGRNNYV